MGLIEFFNALMLGEELGRLMPLCYSSPNVIAPERTLYAVIISIIARARSAWHTWIGYEQIVR